MDENDLIAEVLSDEVDIESIAGGSDSFDSTADTGFSDDGFSAEDLGDEKQITPFSDEEIVNGSAIISMMIGQPITKVKIGDDKQKAALYMHAYQNVFGDYVPTAQLISPLKLGDALARYGVGKGMGPGFSLENLPPFVRLGLGTMVLGMSSFMAFSAVRNLDEQATKNMASNDGFSGRESASAQWDDRQSASNAATNANAATESDTVTESTTPATGS